MGESIKDRLKTFRYDIDSTSRLIEESKLILEQRGKYIGLNESLSLTRDIYYEANKAVEDKKEGCEKLIDEKYDSARRILETINIIVETIVEQESKKANDKLTSEFELIDDLDCRAGNKPTDGVTATQPTPAGSAASGWFKFWPFGNDPVKSTEQSYQQSSVPGTQRL